MAVTSHPLDTLMATGLKILEAVVAGAGGARRVV
jgi:hypothetical protein